MGLRRLRFYPEKTSDDTIESDLVLDISQIKRKFDIDVGEYYNIFQKENQRVPQCLKENTQA